MELLGFDSNSSESCSQWYRKEYPSISSDNGVAPNRRQSIIQVNDALVNYAYMRHTYGRPTVAYDMSTNMMNIFVCGYRHITYDVLCWNIYKCSQHRYCSHMFQKLSTWGGCKILFCRLHYSFHYHSAVYDVWKYSWVYYGLRVVNIYLHITVSHHHHFGKALTM